MALTPKPIVNLTPKERFQESGQNIGTHRDMVDSGEFQRASDFGMMQYSLRLAVDTAKNPQMASLNGYKLSGAHEFLEEMRNLSEKATAPAPVNVVPSLNHRT